MIKRKSNYQKLRKMRRKIGVLGGTFDPFHKGHYMMAKSAYEQFGLDEVWIMPNGNPPHKKNLDKTDFKVRCEMVQLAIADASYMKLCNVEGSDDCYHYTYQTLGDFKEKYPEAAFYFIIGADSLNDFPTWRNPQIITTLCTILVACRDESGIEETEKKAEEMMELFGGEILVMHSPKVDAASKDIRRMVSEGVDVSEYLQADVERYVKEHHLYHAFL